MVDLTGAASPFQQSIPNITFYLPAVVVFGLADVAAAEEAGGGNGYANPGDPEGNFKMPSVDEVWKIIEQMEGISDKERSNLRKSLYTQDGSAERYAQPEMSRTSRDYYIFFTMVALIVLVFALFGYKLFKSLKEKELKKQEKLKSKQSKKAKKSY